MLETVIGLLISICILAIVIYLVIWVVRDVVGLPIPPKIIQLLWVIFALVVLLYVIRLFPGVGYGHFRMSSVPPIIQQIDQA